MNLRELCNKLINCVYNPRTFPGLIVRNRKIKGSVLLFSSGRIVSVGAHAYKALHIIRKRLKSVNVPAEIKNIQIRNCVYAGQMHCPVDINRFNFDGERFPGSHFRVGGATVTVFANGNYFITGVTDQKLIPECQKKLMSACLPNIA